MTRNLFAVVAGVLLSFLSFGVLWAGVNQWLQAIPAAAFLALGYFMSAPQRNASPSLALGAAPLAALLVQFRDRNDSHLLGISIVASWLLAAAFGGWLASRRASTK